MSDNMAYSNRYAMTTPSYCRYCGEKFTDGSSSIMDQFLTHLNKAPDCLEGFRTHDG